MHVGFGFHFFFCCSGCRYTGNVNNSDDRILCLFVIESQITRMRINFFFCLFIKRNYRYNQKIKMNDSS